MRTLTYFGPWDVRLCDKQNPASLLPHEVLVRIRASTICGTDLGIVSGLYEAKKSVTIGHEAAGVVEQVDASVTTVKVGDRVVIDPTYFCQTCWMCRNGFSNHCERKIGTESGVTRDGTFAEFYVTEERFLYKIPESLSFGAACLTEPLSCVLTGLKQLQLRSNLDTAVVGGGPMGMLYAHALALHGLKGAIVETSPVRLVLCRHLCPKGWIVCDSLVAAASAIHSRVGFDLIVDACGSASKASLAMLNRCGQLLLVGLRQEKEEFNPRMIADKSQRIVGSIDSQGTFGEAMALIVREQIPASGMVTQTFTLAEYTTAFGQLGCNIAERSLASTASSMKVAFVL